MNNPKDGMASAVRDSAGVFFSQDPASRLYEAIASRRSVRRYQGEKVPGEKIESLLRLATHAPSACNRRGWRFILIEEKKSLEWLYKKGGAAFIREARQALLVCYFRHTDNWEWRDGEQSASAAVSFFQLLAHAEGIGSCWVCHLPPKKEVARYFSVPPQFTPMCLLTLGYYPQGLNLPERDVNREKILSFERWGFENSSDRDGTGGKALLRKAARKLYYLFPKREWLREYTHRFEKKFPGEDEE